MAPSDFYLAPEATSMAEHIRRHVGHVKVVPPEALSLWLPSLSVPLGWTATTLDMGPITPARVLIRRADDGIDGWIGCEVINLLRFSGTVSDDVIENGAGRALRSLGVNEPITYRIRMPAEVNVIATRSRGTLSRGTRLWIQVSDFVVRSDGGGGLVEHTILINAQARRHLKSDVAQLTESVHSALVTNISSPRPRTARETHRGSHR